MEKKPSLPVDLCGGRRLCATGGAVLFPHGRLDDEFFIAAGDFAFLLVRLAAHFLTHFSYIAQGTSLFPTAFDNSLYLGIRRFVLVQLKMNGYKSTGRSDEAPAGCPFL
ncbi:MAG: hypothetical protein PUD68_03450 [Clostridiales bacterium]|nr:hypothetical protein [Clostridiales bacterium]